MSTQFMTAQQTKLIKDSWKNVEQDALVKLFYQRLFQLDPTLEDLFLNSLTLQQEKFGLTLSTIIEHMDNPVGLSAKVQALGIQHAGFGVTDEHYDLVQYALISALKDLLGSHFCTATQQAWIDAYQAIAEAMKMADIDSISHPI